MIEQQKQKEQTKAFLDLLKRHTKAKIDLHFIHDSTLRNMSESKTVNKKISIAKNIDIADAYMMLKRENAWWKNTEKRENVYWSWSRETEKFNIAFVDDIQKHKFIQENHFCLIQTSQNKYQGLFLLDDYVESAKLAKIQKTLTMNYNGDPGATGTWQLKRMPGFKNTKYVSEPVVMIEYVGNAIVSNIQQHERPAKPRLPRPKKTSKQKTWWDFYTGDYSQTDMKYALYLLNFYPESEVFEILKGESPELYERKGASYVDEYIRRTVLKAVKYYVDS